MSTVIVFLAKTFARISVRPNTPLLLSPEVITHSPLPLMWRFCISKLPVLLVNKSLSLYSPHLTLYNFSSSGANIFPRVPPRQADFL